ncbi:MAG: 5-formyltetrahydrofolate cyclo-ligase [Candidatus Omnitrophica bacterium]|nr:5-formyltetrahydrofolate cyclo-ligase [Candidatus Omnitrophota bacterium]
MKTKAEIRKAISAKLDNHEPKVKGEKDKIIEKRFLSLAEFKQAKVIAFYVSLKTEVSTEALIDRALATGKRVVVPVIVGDDLRLSEIKDRKAELAEGPYGILQPAGVTQKAFPKAKIDLIVVPALAFTESGSRLGRGKGFYDRFLKDLPGSIKKVGLAYDLQITEDLPTTPQDIPVDIVITN